MPGATRYRYGTTLPNDRHVHPDGHGCDTQCRNREEPKIRVQLGAGSKAFWFGLCVSGIPVCQSRRGKQMCLAQTLTRHVGQVFLGSTSATCLSCPGALRPRVSTLGTHTKGRVCVRTLLDVAYEQEKELMTFTYQAKRSDSPYVETVWRTEDQTDGVYVASAD